MFHISGAGFITNIGKKEDNKTYFVNSTAKGAFVVFRVVSRKYSNGETKYESMDCKRFITGDPESFCNLLVKGQFVSINGTMELYYNKEKNINKWSINCTNVDFSPNNNESKKEQTSDQF